MGFFLPDLFLLPVDILRRFRNNEPHCSCEDIIRENVHLNLGVSKILKICASLLFKETKLIHVLQRWNAQIVSADGQDDHGVNNVEAGILS